MIHDGFDYPDSSAVTKFLKLSTEYLIEIIPEEYYTTNDALELSLADRNCLIFDEKEMSDAVQYSFVNCMAECRSKITLENCGCVPFYLPNNGSQKKCMLDKIQCLKEKYQIFSGSVFGENNKNVEKLDATLEYTRNKCECLPSCKNYEYSADISLGAFSRDKTFSSLNFFKDIELKNQTIVHLYFNDLIATRYRKDKNTNWLALLAAFGGLLGLFLGYSMITGFEFLYFCSLRHLFDVLKRK
jgi:amiloride-sensitive sodium channel